MDLEAACTLAEAAFPAVRIAPAAFGAWLAQRDAGRELLAAAADETAAPRAAELWLACAVALGDAAAMRAFEERYVAPLGTTLARMRLADAELDEVKQLVRAKLLVKGEGSGAKIEEYAGRGRLSGLVQVVATREALSLLRRRRNDVADDGDLAAPLADAAVAGDDPGLEALKGRYRVAFRAAFAEAVGVLTPTQRNLLRMHLLGGVTLEQLASVHGVHRASIVRWLKEARDVVLAATRAALGKTLGVRADELASLHALAESRLDASIERLLRSSADHGDAEDHDDH